MKVRGFTLIELLVVVAQLVLVMLLTYHPQKLVRLLLVVKELKLLLLLMRLF